MSNHAARIYMPVFHDRRRESVLGRAMGRKTAALQKPGVAEEDDAGGVMRSRATEDQIYAFFGAWRDGDDAKQRDVLNKIVQTWRADNAAGGLAVYEHPPLPEKFARTMARMLDNMGGAAQPAFGRVTAGLDPSVRTLVVQQIGGMVKQLRSLPSAAVTLDEASHGTMRDSEQSDTRSKSDEFAVSEQNISARLRQFVRGLTEDKVRERHESRLESLDHASVLHSLLESKDTNTAPRTEQWLNRQRTSGEPLPWSREPGRATSLQGAPFGTPPNQPQRKRRIVKPYRRYATPGMGAVDTELQEADALALDADEHIRQALNALWRDPSFDRSNDPLMREFAAAMRRYYAEDGDRAVAGVATRFDSASINARDRYASYDPMSDRILFTKLFSGLSKEEKIITLIHEVLHATPTMKNLAASVGYDRDRIGGKVFAKHEAYLDNVAKYIAKKLGLIPQDYPTTDWRSYYDGRG